MMTRPRTTLPHAKHSSVAHSTPRIRTRKIAIGMLPTGAGSGETLLVAGMASSRAGSLRPSPDHPVRSSKRGSQPLTGERTKTQKTRRETACHRLEKPARSSLRVLTQVQDFPTRNRLFKIKARSASDKIPRPQGASLLPPAGTASASLYQV